MLSKRVRVRNRGLNPAALARLRRFAAQAQKAARLTGPADFLLAADSEVRALNRRFRGKDRVTDVLSFPATRGAGGDVAIALGVARRQAAERGHSLEEEIKILMLHGILHLAGMDHEKDGGGMRAREELLRRRLRLPCGLIARGHDHARAASSSRKPAPRARASAAGASRSRA